MIFDILSIIPSKISGTSLKGWHKFNAICCHHKGHNPDKKARAGINFTGMGAWTYHCFNCGFICSFEEGKSISHQTKQLLTWCGIDEGQIFRWNIASLAQRELVEIYTPKPKEYGPVHFESQDLPAGYSLIDRANPEHQKYIDYLATRGTTPEKYPFLVNPHDEGRHADKIVIPMTVKGKVIGYTSRFIDDGVIKYLKNDNQQVGALFGYDLQLPNWKYCIVTEGPFDALSIDGIGLLHNTISREQARVLSELNRKIIVVPDFDHSGLEITEQAFSLGYMVSLPPFEGVKDVNDAVLKYGKLSVLMSIVQHATSNQTKIEFIKKRILRHA